MNEVQKALKEKFSHLHPMVFNRSLEKAKTDGELFDILSTIPKELPIMWCEEKRVWITTELLQKKSFIERE